MTAVVAPYGLIPVKKLGSRYDTAGVRMLPIASGYAANIFYGDVVKLVLNTTPVTLEKDTGTATATPVGVFLGCEYTDPVFGKLQRQYWPSGTVAADAVAYVCDDPQALFSAALVSGTTVISGSALTSLLGKNAALVQNAGSTTTGKSAVALSGLATTNTLPIRVIDVVRGSEDSSGNYTAALVKWNFGMHQYDRALGL